MNTHPKTATISATVLQRKIGSIIRRVARDGEHITVERDGFPVVMMISVAEYARLKQDQAHLRAALRSKHAHSVK
jgi:prevent-host-death family protein